MQGTTAASVMVLDSLNYILYKKLLQSILKYLFDPITLIAFDGGPMKLRPDFSTNWANL